MPSGRQELDAEEEMYQRNEEMSQLKSEFDRNLQKLTDSYWPGMTPLKGQIYTAVLEQRWLSLELRWKARLAEELARHRSGFDWKEHTRDLRAAELARLDAQFAAAIKALEDLTPADMQVLRGYDDPPEIVWKVLNAVLLVKDEEGSAWDEVRVTFTDSYFFVFFNKRAKNYDRDSISEEKLGRLEAFVTDPSLDPVAAITLPNAGHALAGWVRALYDHGKATRILRYDGAPLDAVQRDVERLQERLRRSRAEAAGAEQQLVAQQEEYQQRVAQLKARYDAALEPLQETFFEAHHRYNAAAAASK